MQQHPYHSRQTRETTNKQDSISKHVEKINKKRTNKNTTRREHENEENDGKTKQEWNYKNLTKSFYFSAYHFDSSPTDSTKLPPGHVDAIRSPAFVNETKISCCTNKNAI